MDDQPIVLMPPPWKLKGTVYMVTFYSKAGNLPEYAYPSLEKVSSFAGRESGKHLGGVSQFQFIRYTGSPAGPYDELIVSPGFFEYEVEGVRGKREKKKNARITNIYVSQKCTCWNGRHRELAPIKCEWEKSRRLSVHTDWNIPKHLARFEWEDSVDGSTSVKVFPLEEPTSHLTNARHSPLFQATFRQIKFTPSFPFSLSWAKYIGLDVSLVQPPLPEGCGLQGELAGTKRWCKILPDQKTKTASLGWIDMSQDNEQGTIAGNAVSNNFWPGLGRWQLGVKLEDADVTFGEGIYWDPPRTNQ